MVAPQGGYSGVPSTTPAPVPGVSSSSGIVWIGSDGQPSAPPSAAALHALMQPAVQPPPPAGSSSTSSPASPGGQDPSRPNGLSVNGHEFIETAITSGSDPTATGVATAQSDGTIVFTFQRSSGGPLPLSTWCSAACRSVVRVRASKPSMPQRVLQTATPATARSSLTV